MKDGGGGEEEEEEEEEQNCGGDSGTCWSGCMVVGCGWYGAGFIMEEDQPSLTAYCKSAADKFFDPPHAVND